MIHVISSRQNVTRSANPIPAFDTSEALYTENWSIIDQHLNLNGFGEGQFIQPAKTLTYLNMLGYGWPVYLSSFKEICV